MAVTQLGSRRPARHEPAIRTMLIPVNTACGAAPADAVEVALRLAAERRASIVLLLFTEIPLDEELDMEIDGLGEEIARLTDEACAHARRYGLSLHTTHVRTRDPAALILSQADRHHSQLIVLGAGSLHRTRYQMPMQDPTVRQILAEAKQRVMILQSTRAA
jgi:nucleotide-binding universal stress UspA family protein